MMSRRFLFTVLVCTAGCGPSVVTDSSSSGGSSTGGDGGGAGTLATTTTSTGGGAGGSGGNGGTIELGGGGAAGGGAGAPGYCAGNDFYFDISGDGPDQHYDATCQPMGYLVMGGGPPPPDEGPPQPPPGVQFLQFTACSIMDMGILFGSATMELPGSTTEAYVSYETASSNQGNIDITEFGDVGQAIVGEYSVIVSGSDPGSPTYDLSGTFRLCRMPDLQVP